MNVCIYVYSHTRTFLSFHSLQNSFNFGSAFSPKSSKLPPHHTQTSRGQDVGSAPKPAADVWTPAGVAKMLIKDGNRISSKDLKEGLEESSMMRSRPRPPPCRNVALSNPLSCCATPPPPFPRQALSSGGGGVGVQDRQLREAIFLKKIQRHIKEEQAVYIKW